VLGRLEEEAHERRFRNLAVLVAVARAQEPQVALGVDLLDAHRPGAARSARADGRAEEARLGLLDQLADAFDGIGTAEIGAIVFGLLTIDGIHAKG